MRKTRFITGTTRGFGVEIAKAALRAGDRVVATGRKLASVAASVGRDSDRLLCLELDVCDPEKPRAAVRAAVEKFGGIDVLVNTPARPFEFLRREHPGRRWGAILSGHP
jgi:NAD(P)-dependent dehydrogenase (short-subunit alcohol dehydrogenase family)